MKIKLSTIVRLALAAPAVIDAGKVAVAGALATVAAVKIAVAKAKPARAPDA